MMKLALAGTFALLAWAPANNSPWFSGLIVYRNELQTLAGEPVVSDIGTENRAYFQGDSYKVCDDNQSVLELFNGKTNTFQAFREGNPVAASNVDALREQLVITHLPSTAVVLGYPCQAVRLVRGPVSSITYFSPLVRVNPQGYRKSPARDWYALLKATDGALPLRTISIDSKSGHTLTKEATLVQPMALAPSEFAPTAPAR